MSHCSFDRNIRKVLLINPFKIKEQTETIYAYQRDFHGIPPMGIGYISSYIKKFLPDIEIEVYDAYTLGYKISLEMKEVSTKYLWDILRDKLSQFKPDMVGIQMISHVVAEAGHKTAAVVKESDPGIVVISGGLYPHTSYNEVLKDPNIDLVGFSEGEAVVTDLIRSINAKTDLKTVKGIAYRDNGGHIVKTAAREPINLDTAPDCDRSNFDLRFHTRYGHTTPHRFIDAEKDLWVIVGNSRGCHGVCTFCCGRNLFANGGFRQRNPALMVDEMQRLQDRYGATTFIFNEDCISADRSGLVKLAQEIRRRMPGIKWHVLEGIPIGMLDDETVNVLYESGHKWFKLPCESGSNETLRKVRKNHSVEDVYPVISSIRKFDDAWVCIFLITGFPFEPEENIEKNIEYARKLAPDWVYIFPFTPYPGSVLYRECVDAGYVRDFIYSPEQGPRTDLRLRSPGYEYIDEKSAEADVILNYFENRNIKLRPRMAIRDFEHMLTIKTDNAPAMYGLGAAYRELKDPQKSEKWFAKAAETLETTEPHFKEYFRKAGIDLGEVRR